MNFKDYKICHIYGQQMWHDQAIIIGNKEGLEQLKNMIDIALNENQSEEVFYPVDLAGYNLKIMCVEDDEKLEHLSLPYHDENYYTKSDDEISPENILKKSTRHK
ncbi:hypothetical protein CQZ94_10705 [Bacillus sp. MYb209]|uniref:hypothetical protein n=1 Tax=Bacillus sp. MYb209 TaxID=1848605 RepID=UPI000CFDB107|nr:hypothetical protein [Bacillus sp. MYb209]PQZ57295.1 hypothetical protein CQZ94_10705 [Bacillus sp. MYb209]